MEPNVEDAISSPRGSDDNDRAEFTALISGHDRPGLVAAVSGCLYEHGANIIDSDQHTDHEAGAFLQRIRFAVPSRQAGSLRLALDRQCRDLALTCTVTNARQRRRVAIFVSRLDHCLCDLLLRRASGELAFDLACIISNHDDLAPIAATFGLDFHVFPINEANRFRQEAAELTLLAERRVDLIVLARYMQVVSEQFVSRYESQIINIHHSFLPAFAGARPYHQAFSRGVKLIGATAHCVTTALDEGPIIGHDVVETSHRDSVDDFIRKGRDVERTVLARAVRWHLEDRLLIYGNRTVVFA